MRDSLNLIGFGCQRHHYTHHVPGSCQKYPKAYVNHMLGWQGFQPTQTGINKIILHSTSGILCTTPELYGSLSLALSCISGNQTPRAVKSKRSVAAFKVITGTLVGARSTIRSALDFCYKWTFLSASEHLNGRVASASVGTSVFTLN